jgi:hypothetical protein
MQQRLIKHCKHCKNLDQADFCDLRNLEIEKPSWTTCKNWNAKGKIDGPLYSIVYDYNRYYELPYWSGNRPEAKMFVFDYHHIVVKDESNERLVFQDCASYLRNYCGEHDLDILHTYEPHAPQSIEIEIKLTKQLTPGSSCQSYQSVRSSSLRSVGEILKEIYKRKWI